MDENKEMNLVVKSIDGIDPIHVNEMREISIRDASTQQKGACLLANNSDTITGTGSGCVTPTSLKEKLGDQTLNLVAVAKGKDQVFEYWQFFSSDGSIIIEADIVNKRFNFTLKSNEENKDPILITQDSQLNLNRRHIIKAPILKTLNLSIDENCKVGDWIEIKNMDLGNFQINSGNNIDIIMNGLITRVKNGYIRSKKRGDFIKLECMEISPKIIFSDTNTIGNFTII